MQEPMPNPKDITDPTTAMNMALVLMVKAFKLNYSTPTNNNHRISSNPRNRQISQAVPNLGVQNVGNQNGLIVVLLIANQNGNGNVVAARAEGNAIGNNGNQIRCYNCRGLGHLARNYTVRPRRRDAAYLQTQLLIAQKEEAGIQLQAEEFDLMAKEADLYEIEEFNANCILMANLQQASTSGTQTDRTPAYDSDGSTEIHQIFKMSLNIRKNNLKIVSLKRRMNMLYFGMIGTKNVKNASMTKIERLQAQLGDQKGKSTDTPCVSDTFNPLSQKLENENVELEFQVWNYEKENEYLKTTYKNLFDSIKVTRAQTKLIIDSLQQKLHDTIYENATLRAQLFDKVSEQRDTTKGVDNPAKTRRPQPRSNTKNDKVPSTSKSSCSKNKEVEVEEHPRNLLLSKNKKHISSECNNVKLVIRNDKSKVICAMCKQCLITANHDVCVLNYVNDINSCDMEQKANVSNIANQMKHNPHVKKPKKVGSTKRLASPNPSDVFQKL
ncbi:hypothetical protein Tco_0442357 [Tanacetum coccineum]